MYKRKNTKRKRKHGFLARSRTKGGQTILNNRRGKGRKKITV